MATAKSASKPSTVPGTVQAVTDTTLIEPERELVIEVTPACRANPVTQPAAPPPPPGLRSAPAL